MKYFYHAGTPNLADFFTTEIEEYNEEKSGKIKTILNGKTSLLYHGSLLVDSRQVFDNFEDCKAAACKDWNHPVYYKGEDINKKNIRRYGWIGGVYVEIL